MCRRGELCFPGVGRRAAPRAAHEASVDLLCSCASSLCSRHLKIAVRACERAWVFFTSLIIHQEQGFYIYIYVFHMLFLPALDIIQYVTKGEKFELLSPSSHHIPVLKRPHSWHIMPGWSCLSLFSKKSQWILSVNKD